MIAMIVRLGLAFGGKMATDISTHDTPAWRADANFIIFADLSKWGLEGKWEQLWAKQITESEFIICCIPYFTYGIALGDKVRTEFAKGKQHVVSEVVDRSGHRVVRLWLKNAPGQVRDDMESFMQSYSLLHEWSSINLLVIDVPDDSRIASNLRTFLEKAEKEWLVMVEAGE
jgi:hypothetical protein